MFKFRHQHLFVYSHYIARHYVIMIEMQNKASFVYCGTWHTCLYQPANWGHAKVFGARQAMLHRWWWQKPNAHCPPHALPVVFPEVGMCYLELLTDVSTRLHRERHMSSIKNFSDKHYS